MKGYHVRLAILFLFIIIIGEPACSQVVFDSTFHFDGKAFGPGYATANHAHVLQSKKTIITGNTGLYCYKENGTLDSTFGSLGFVSFNTGTPYLCTIAKDSFFTLSKDYDNNGKDILKIIKWQANGKGVSTWANYGAKSVYITDSFGNNWGCTARSIAVQPDGKILIAGTMTTSVGVIKRFKPDGAIDSSFGLNGTIWLDVASCGYQPLQFHFVTGPRILITGMYYASHSVPNYGVIRIKDNGSYDSLYGVNGIVYYPVGSPCILNESVLQKDEKLLMVGTSGYATGADIAVLRLRQDGLLDSQYAINGLLLHTIAFNSSDEGNSACLDSNGNLYVAATSQENGWSSFLLYKIKDNGVVDSSFNDIGSFEIERRPAQLKVGCVRVLKDEKVVLCGYVNNQQFLARINTKPWIEILNSKKSFCKGDTVKLYCHSPTPKKWFSNNTLLPDTTKEFKAYSNGIYYVVTTLNGISDTSNEVTLVFNVVPQPIISQTVDTLMCTVNSSFFIQWLDSSLVNIPGATNVKYFPSKDGKYYVKVTDSSGCSSISNVYHFVGSSYVKNDASINVTAYPCPTKDYFFIDIKTDNAGETLVCITDVTGHVFYAAEHNANSIMTIDVRTLPSGIYYYCLLTESGEKLYSGKLIKD